MIFTKLSDFRAWNECIGIENKNRFSMFWHLGNKVENYSCLYKFGKVIIASFNKRENNLWFVMIF